MNKAFAYVNGRIVPEAGAGIGVQDRGVLYGDGLYETIRVRNGRCLRLEKHSQRLRRGLETLGIADPFGESSLEETVGELLQANGLTDARVRVMVTRGISVDADESTITATAVPLSDTEPREAKAVISSYRRDEASPLTRVKSINCLASVMAGIEARRAGADEAILLNTRGRVAEAAFANVFVVMGRRLLTPPPEEGCLPGTVRAAVIEMAPVLGLEAEETHITPEQMLAADEVFLTSAIRLVRAVPAIDGKAVGRGTYPVSAKIREALLAGEQPGRFTD